MGYLSPETQERELKALLSPAIRCAVKIKSLTENKVADSKT